MSIISSAVTLLAATKVAIPTKNDSSMSPLFIAIIVVLIIWALYNAASSTETSSRDKRDPANLHGADNYGPSYKQTSKSKLTALSTGFISARGRSTSTPTIL